MRFNRKGWTLALALMLAVFLPAKALAETSFEGTVVAGETVGVTAPFGGVISNLSLRAGSKINLGEPIATMETTKVYAPEDGVVTGLFAEPGDGVEDVTTRYGAVLFIAPTRKYSIAADIEKAYNSSDTKYVQIGETVYIACTSDGAHKATGIITKAEGTGYTVETTSGELLMEETVSIYRSEDRTTKSRIGRGTVSRTSEVAVKGTGSVLTMHVSDGDSVSRGDLLFETVEDTINGLYATSNEILSEVSGVVATVDVSAGTKVSKGTTLMTVYTLESMQVEIDVDEYDLARIHEGDQVTLSFNWDEEAQKSYSGTVDMISHVSSATESDAIYKAYIDFEPDESIRLGMTVTVYTVGEGDAQEEESHGVEDEQDAVEEPGEEET